MEACPDNNIDFSNDMLLRMEKEMTKGMTDQIPSNALDTMLNEIS